MNRKILITGGKGGVGKTTVTASIGITLASRGIKTVLMDGDIGLNNLDIALRAEDKILYDIGDVAQGKASIEQALVRVEKNLFLMPSATACPSAVDSDGFSEIASELSGVFPFLLIDCPAGIDQGFLRAARSATESIIVTTPQLSGVRDGYKTSKILYGLGFNRQSLIVNRFNASLAAKKLSLDADEIAEAMKLPLAGLVPESEELEINGLLDIGDVRSPVTVSYNMIADVLTGRSDRVFDCRRRPSVFRKYRI